jgi:hypothetical protein
MPDDNPPPSTPRRRYLGPERRNVDRLAPAPVKVIGRARVRPEHARHVLSLAPGRWYPLIEQPVGGLLPTAAGYAWIDLDGRPRSVWSAFLEVELDREG